MKKVYNTRINHYIRGYKGMARVVYPYQNRHNLFTNAKNGCMVNALKPVGNTLLAQVRDRHDKNPLTLASTSVHRSIYMDYYLKTLACALYSKLNK